MHAHKLSLLAPARLVRLHTLSGSVPLGSASSDERGERGSSEHQPSPPHVPVLFRWVLFCPFITQARPSSLCLAPYSTFYCNPIQLSYNSNAFSEVLELLKPSGARKLCVYVDGTLGSGGHASMVVQAHEVREG
jgi:hypothetical protein